MSWIKGKQYFKPAMKKLSECNITGLGNSASSPLSVEAGKLLLESLNENQLEAFGLNSTMRESILSENAEEIRSFSEDNTMSNSSDWYTTVLGKFVYYKAWNNFEHIINMAVVYTPADLGMPEGAGAYKIPKVEGATAVKLSSGQLVNYSNDGKGSSTLETETFGIGTRINHRLIKRAAKGAIQKLLVAASESVSRAVATDVINSIIVGAASANTQAVGITYEAIEKAKAAIRAATNTKGELFGFEPDKIAFSTVGWRIYATSTDFKTMATRDQRMTLDEALKTKYRVIQDLLAFQAPIISVTKSSKVVHAVVVDSRWAAGFLKEEVGTVDGRIPGTLDMESIAYMDAGIVITASEAISVITAA